MDSGIYCIENIANGRIYIGATYNIKKRKDRHFSDLSKGNHWNKDLQDDFNKYGREFFLFGILIYCSKDKLVENETNFISKYKNQLYNLELSGKHHMHSEETKKLISDKTSGKNNGFYGKKHTEENRKKMAEASRKWNAENDNPTKGTKVPLDRKLKIAKKLLTLTDEDLFKIKEMLLENTYESFRQKYLRIAPLFNVSDTLIKKIKMGNHSYASYLLGGNYENWIKEMN